jgi:multidrug resistance efflux pump
LLLLSRIEQLETDLREARKEANVLRAANERLECDLKNAKAAQTTNRSNPLFRRVGLDECAPEWLVMAVRRAYRKRLHPDAHPEGQKAEAERRFKEAEGVFDEIWKLRGFQT